MRPSGLNFLKNLSVCSWHRCRHTVSKKEKALWDIHDLLEHRKGVVCFVFDAKYILPDLSCLDAVYCEVKRNRDFLSDATMDEFCRMLVRSDNAFDCNALSVRNIRAKSTRRSAMSSLCSANCITVQWF